MKKYIAELFGTFALTLIVIVTSVTAPALTPFLAALTLGLFVYSVGHVSGAHLNPAVTIGVWSLNKIKFPEALFYIVSQFIGAYLALYASNLLIADLALKLLPFKARLVNDPLIGFAEGLGMILFAFGIASVVYGKTQKDVSGAVVGGSLLVGIFIASAASNGILNPAVALGLGSFNAMYIIGPVIGATLGMQIYKILANE